ncbi:AraC family transcriptional regulator [Asticcacaulis sp. 201]|uniref:AraC family transcriptional regulator n=1 Tax=Asticcacaulis sp. 201 TaxID=3028787 RepID=UPI002916C17C|nr:AraC family transcriptional regulator [Asticcacaulis sp. 201]MDV6332628.1 AraC family transcriptional regulator [Asticcacaulis sp. 201]
MGIRIPPFERYRTRMQRVLDFIDQHLDEDLGLDVLSGIAAFSKYHFHRQFNAVFGLPAHRYVQLARMKRASYQLAYRDQMTVTEVALHAGFEAPEAFGRAFRQHFGQSPSSFRKSPKCEPWLEQLGPLVRARNRLSTPYTSACVQILDVSDVPVAVMTHQGDPTKISETIRRFIAWRKSAGLRPQASTVYNIFHSEPHPVTLEDYHVDIAVSYDRAISFRDDGVTAGVIPGGRCAMLRVVGSNDDLEPAASFLYRDWLPQSGEELRGFPLYCRRIRFFPDVTENEATAELYLPLK